MTERDHSDETLREILEAHDKELPGKRLREAREAAKLTREEVAHHLHLDPQIVSALESDKYDKLPSAIYVCGYLRSYARLLKLPEVEIVNAYSQGKEINASLIPENVKILPDKKVVNPAILRVIGILVVLFAVLAGGILLGEKFGLLGYLDGNDEQMQSQTIEQFVPELQPESETAAVSAEIEVPEEVQQETIQPSAEEIDRKITEFENVAEQEQKPVVREELVTDARAELRFVFKDESWIEVKDADNTQLLYRLAEAGSELSVGGNAPFTILLGNAAQVEVYYKGDQFDHSRYRRNKVAYFRIGTKQ